MRDSDSSESSIIDHANKRKHKRFVGPDINCAPMISVQVEQFGKRHARIRITINHVDVSSNPEGKKYSDKEIRRFIGTFLEINKLFSTITNTITTVWKNNHSLVINLDYDIYEWGIETPYYRYHEAMSMVDLFINGKTKLFEIITEKVNDVHMVKGYLFQPCDVAGLILKSSRAPRNEEKNQKAVSRNYF